MTSKDFEYITIRGRVAFAICCVENAVDRLDKGANDWSLVFDFLWRYCNPPEIRTR